MWNNQRGLPAEQNCPGGEEPSRVAPATGVATATPVATDEATKPKEQLRDPCNAHTPGWEDLFADFPRPADRRAQEFLPQWLRRLGRG